MLSSNIMINMGLHLNDYICIKDKARFAMPKTGKVH